MRTTILRCLPLPLLLAVAAARPAEEPTPLLCGGERPKCPDHMVCHLPVMACAGLDCPIGTCVRPVVWGTMEPGATVTVVPEPAEPTGSVGDGDEDGEDEGGEKGEGAGEQGGPEEGDDFDNYKPCGGFRIPDQEPCAENEWCVEDPRYPGPCNFACDLPGICFPLVRCATIMGLACPEGQDCFDDPRDDCDPLAGWSDCAGICLYPDEGVNRGLPHM